MRVEIINERNGVNKMKIKTKVLTTFLDKVSMADGQEVKECLLMFGVDGLKIRATPASKQAFVSGWLKTPAFKEYEENFGNVATDDLPTMIGVFERFGEFVSFKKEGNLLSISGDNKKVDIELVSETFVSTTKDEPELNFVDTFDTTATRLKDVFKDVKLNKDSLINITTEAKKAVLTNTGKYKFRNEINGDGCKGGANSSFGQPLIDATQKLSGPVEISIAVNYPIKIMEKEEFSVVSVIVAPRVSEE
jgi:hypothetical protein